MRFFICCRVEGARGLIAAIDQLAQLGDLLTRTIYSRQEALQLVVAKFSPARSAMARGCRGE